MKLVIKNLEKKFGTKEVLKDINFEFESGKIYGLLGRNGAGKTTLFNCLNEDLEIDNGSFFIEDKETRKVEASDIGVINVQDISTFVEVLNNKGDMVLKALQSKNIKGRPRKVTKVDM